MIFLFKVKKVTTQIDRYLNIDKSIHKDNIL
jgi:hypothetical protein